MKKTNGVSELKKGFWVQLRHVFAPIHDVSATLQGLFAPLHVSSAPMNDLAARIHVITAQLHVLAVRLTVPAAQPEGLEALPVKRQGVDLS